jgi:hypothetical protein
VNGCAAFESSLNARTGAVAAALPKPDFEAQRNLMSHVKPGDATVVLR